jgi:hypothetical protein
MGGKCVNPCAQPCGTLCCSDQPDQVCNTVLKTCVHCGRFGERCCADGSCVDGSCNNTTQRCLVIEDGQACLSDANFCRHHSCVNGVCCESLTCPAGQSCEKGTCQ